MAEKGEQVREDQIEEATRSPSDIHDKDKIPVVLIEATENAHHIHMGWRSWVVIFMTSFASVALAHTARINRSVIGGLYKI